jgi:hypothetical protein
MRNVRNLRKSVLLAAVLSFAAACSSSSTRWSDDTSTSPIEPAGGGKDGGGGPGSDPSDAAGGGDGRVPPGGDGSTPPPPPPPPGDAGTGPDSVDAAIYATPIQCSSGTTGTSSNNANMQPGSSCRTCHVLGGSASGKTWDIAGTVYATAHEPDMCNGTSMSGVTIEITDATGAKTSIAVNGVGNFYHADLFGFGKIPTPYTAKVIYGGKERAMFTPQTEGDCDSCHTESGTKSAPGRIMLP